MARPFQETVDDEKVRLAAVANDEKKFAETEPILGRPSDELLDGAASVAVLFPPP